jgi:hypothetical protein
VPPPVTISRPGAVVGPTDVLVSPPRRQLPLVVKVAAAVAAVGLIAGLNLAAAEREDRAARAAADRVDVTLVPVGGEAHDGVFGLALLVDNHAGVLQLAGARLEPPTSYDIVGVSASSLPAATTAQVAVQVRPVCPSRGVAATRLVLSVVPRSGKGREVAVATDARLLADLSRQACGFLTAAEAAEPEVVAVTAQTRYHVDFLLRVHNRSSRPFTIHDIVGVALAFAVEGGVPTVVPANGDLELRVRVALPRCAALPPAGEPSVPLYGSFSFELSDADGNAETLPYLADGGDPVHPALIGLRSRICPPGSYRSHPPG